VEGGSVLDQKLIDAVYEARQQSSDAGRPEAVAKVHAGGHLTARERLAALLDPGSEVEFGTLEGKGDRGWVPTRGGVDFVGTIDGHPAVASSTDYSDHGGGYGAGQLGRLFTLAHQNRWPVVLFSDGGGSRAQWLDQSVARFSRLQARYGGGSGFFEALAALAGWVPLAAVISGPSFAGHATLAAFCDFIVSTRGSAIGMGGPPMVEAAFGTRLKPVELGPVKMHEQVGAIELLVDDERSAILAVRAYLSYYHDLPSGKASSTADSIRSLVPDQGAYDMHRVIAALVDEGSFFELRPHFAVSVLTGFARMEGRSVGILANQPQSPNGGAIDSNAADKTARFVQLCEAYGLPMVSLIDAPDLTIRLEDGTEQPGMTRHHARPVRALHHRTIPLISIQIRKGYGFAPALLSGIGTAHRLPLLRLAWPTAELGVKDLYSQGFDDVVDPAETRDRILRMLRLTRRSLPAQRKRRPRDSW